MIAATPLEVNHIKLGALMVDFHHWNLPLHYGSQIEEHLSVRQSAGMFDVSHMTIVDVLGAGGRQFLRKLLTNDVDKLQHAGRALYSCMCNEHGGILDDLIVYQRAADNYRLVLNAATKAKDLAWIQEKSQGFAIGLQERRDLAIISVQGPEAFEKMKTVLTPARTDAISTLTPFDCVDIEDYFFAATGYTGEKGFEVILPNAKAPAFWESMLEAGIKPCGLGARDTLRLEAGLLLYGQDMNETTTPLESGLERVVQWEPEDRDFIGMGALLSKKQQGIKRKLVGLVLEEKGIMRTGQQLFANGQVVGVITSGSWSPSLSRSIALARVVTDLPETVFVEIRNNQLPVRITKPRFIKNGISMIDTPFT